MKAKFESVKGIKTFALQQNFHFIFRVSSYELQDPDEAIYAFNYIYILW